LLPDENSVRHKSIKARLQSLNQAGVFRLTEKCHGAHPPQVEPVGKFARTKVVSPVHLRWAIRSARRGNG
jgi:hypothetical protein